MKVDSKNQIMKNNIETSFAGWSFIIAAALLWIGWGFNVHQTGEYLVASDFEVIGTDVWHWIWMYRLHIFGWVAMAIALFSFTTFTMKSPFRAVLLPGLGMLIVGTFTLSIAAAFYYTFGAWGIGQIEGMSTTELDQFMDGLLFTNHYATCFLRFGRIFSGVGLVIMGYVFLKWGLMPKWLGVFTTVLGLVAVSIILFIPDNFDVYQPVFHVKVVWLIAMGVTLLRQGVDLSKAEDQ